MAAGERRMEFTSRNKMGASSVQEDGGGGDAPTTAGETPALLTSGRSVGALSGLVRR